MNWFLLGEIVGGVLIFWALLVLLIFLWNSITHNILKRRYIKSDGKLDRSRPLKGYQAENKGARGDREFTEGKSGTEESNSTTDRTIESIKRAILQDEATIDSRSLSPSDSPESITSRRDGGDGRGRDGVILWVSISLTSLTRHSLHSHFRQPLLEYSFSPFFFSHE